MAKNQRLLKESGLESLTDQLNSGNTVNQYTSGTPNFGLALTDFCWLNNFRVDDAKIKQMVASANSDVECAILLYEALPDLNGLFASYAQGVLDRIEAAVKAGELPGASLELPNYEGVRINFDKEHGCGWLLIRNSLHDPVMPMNVERTP